MRNLPKVYSQRDPQWASQRLGTVNGSTIGAYGCYVTSFAIIAEYYGKNVTPAQLDDFFTNGHVYYNADGSHNDPANYSSDNMLQTIYGDILFQGIHDYSNTPADLNLLKTLLSDPTISVILELDFDHDPNDGIQTHFVVAVDCDGKKVTIADPWQIPGSIDDITKNYGNNPTQTILKFVVYKGNPIAGASDTNYKGLDLTNKDSMKVAVDAWYGVSHGDYVVKAQYDADVAKARQDALGESNAAIAKAQTDVEAYEHACALFGLQKNSDGSNPSSQEIEQAIKDLKQLAQDRLSSLNTANGKLKKATTALNIDPASDYDLGVAILEIEKDRDAAIKGYSAAKLELDLTENAADKEVITAIDNLKTQPTPPSQPIIQQQTITIWQEIFNFFKRGR